MVSSPVQMNADLSTAVSGASAASPVSASITAAPLGLGGRTPAAAAASGNPRRVPRFRFSIFD